MVEANSKYQTFFGVEFHCDTFAIVVLELVQTAITDTTEDAVRNIPVVLEEVLAAAVVVVSVISIMVETTTKAAVAGHPMAASPSTLQVMEVVVVETTNRTGSEIKPY